MCSITPRRIAVIGSSTSPTWSGGAGGEPARRGAAAPGRAGRPERLGGATGAQAPPAARRPACAAAGVGRGRRRGCPHSMYARMSFFVTRPPVPVPATAFGSTPCSAAIRATTGETNVRPFPGGCVRCGRRPVRLAGSEPRRCERSAAPCCGRLEPRRGSGAAGPGSARRARRPAAPAGRDHRQHRSDLDRLALGDEHLGDDPLSRARDLGVDLVGRDLEQRLVLGDRLARLLEPFRDRPLRDRDAHLGHHHLDLRSGSHDRFTLLVGEARFALNMPRALGARRRRRRSAECMPARAPARTAPAQSGAAIRLTGPSRCSNASSAIVAAISAPNPPVRVSSCRTSTFDVRRALSSTASRSHGISVRRSSTSTETPSASSTSAASSAV